MSNKCFIFQTNIFADTDVILYSVGCPILLIFFFSTCRSIITESNNKYLITRELAKYIKGHILVSCRIPKSYFFLLVVNSVVMYSIILQVQKKYAKT